MIAAKKKAKTKKKSTRKYAYEYQVSKDLRYGNKAQHAALIAWCSRPVFAKRRPTPEELIAECLKLDSPLHGLMKTNEREAAQTYWRQTAQDILRHINVIKLDIVTHEQIGEPVNAYLPIRRETYGRIPEENYYQTKSRVMDNPLVKKTIVQQMHSEFVSWYRRWMRYAEFLEEFSPVVEAYKSLGGVLENVGD